MFDLYAETDDEAGAKGCFKCGNPFGDPVYVSFSAQAIGCTACCKNPKSKEKWDKFDAWVKTHFAQTIAENKRRKTDGSLL